jgi:hypothetical protein
MQLIGREGFNTHRSITTEGEDYIQVYTTELTFDNDSCDPYIKEVVTCRSIISSDISAAYAEQAMLELLKTHETL